MPISEEMGQAFYNKAEVQKTGAIRYLDEALEAAIAASPPMLNGMRGQHQWHGCGTGRVFLFKACRSVPCG